MQVKVKIHSNHDNRRPKTVYRALKDVRVCKMGIRGRTHEARITLNGKLHTAYLEDGEWFCKPYLREG